MSIIEPKIDVLLDQTDDDRFLLCALASKRAHDINEMMRGQRNRAIQLQTAVDIEKLTIVALFLLLLMKLLVAMYRMIHLRLIFTITKPLRIFVIND